MKKKGGFQKGNTIGHRFKPGESGNPLGQPKNPFPALIRGETENGAEIIRRVMKIFREAKSQKIALMAAEFLRDTGWGRPVQPLRGEDEAGSAGPIQIQFVPINKPT